jgi:hypothetical protein
MSPKNLSIALLGLVIVTILYLTLRCDCFLEKELQRSKPSKSTEYKKKLSESEWKHFDYAVKECRVILKSDALLLKKADYWENYGIDPAVGYAAWLFQETRFKGDVVGDNGKAYGYGQIHSAALEEMNEIRAARGWRKFSLEELNGRSRERVKFFLFALHDYINLCSERYGRKRNLDADLNAWNGGCSGGSEKENKYSGEIKSIILQYHERKKAGKETKQKRASAKH